MLTTRNSAEANAELDEMARELAYQSLRYSDLWPLLENDQWDDKSVEFGKRVRGFIDGLIDAELTRIESETSK